MIKKSIFSAFTLFLVHAAAQSCLAETNYIALQNKCQSNVNAGCCISSVRAMRDGKFQQATDGKCPAGTKANMYRCAGSLSWCEPMDVNDIAVNGGGIGNFKKEAKDSKEKEALIEEEKDKEKELLEQKK
jgi:hypothetical protein